jgi:hypothetical protein
MNLSDSRAPRKTAPVRVWKRMASTVFRKVRRWRGVRLLALALSASLGIAGCGRLPDGHDVFSYRVDPRLALPAMPPSPGQPAPPPLAVVRDPGGHTYTFASNQVVLRPRNTAALRGFLTRYGGTVLSDGTSRFAPKRGKLAPPRGAYLIRVDPRRSPVDDLAASMRSAHLSGRYTFSSADAVRLVALVGRERRGADISLDPSLYPTGLDEETQILEGQGSDGKPFNYAAQGYTTGTRDLAKSQLGIGVVRAWDYLRYKGIPFGQQQWRRPVVAIVDGGFALDTTTGAPLDDNPDFEMGRRPVQLNEDILLGGDPYNAGGTNPASCGSDCPWHGTGVFSVAAAVPRNQFGSAGTGAEIVKPYLIRVNARLGFEVAQGISDAAALNPPADVINLSMGGGVCGSFCGFFYATAFADMQSKVDYARQRNAVVVAAAGNNGEGDNSRYDNPPCTLDGVLCVGAISLDGNRRTYAGVSIWAPDCITVTPFPGSGAQLGNAFCGTSAAAPFVAGIVALMKALKPGLIPWQVQNILHDTALPSPDPVVVPGYVNALGAVIATSPNDPPTITINDPKAGASVLYGKQVQLMSTVSDPDQAPAVDGVTVTWTSSIDGLLCTGIACDSKPLSPGTHTITATVTDPLGGTASASVDVSAVSGGPPVAAIHYPPDNATFFSSQQVNLRGNATSPNGPIPDANLEWSSSLKTGVLGTGSNRWFSLPVGQQTITLTAKSKTGQIGTASIHLDVQAGKDYPTVAITQPQDFSSFGLNGTITFAGFGTDPQDGLLPDASLRWTSDIDGPLGTGGQVTAKLSGHACAPVEHHITLTGTNQAGRQATATITVLVGTIC